MNRNTNYNKGFSLVEVSIALIIIGLILGPLIMLYQARVISLKYSDAQAKATKIETALNEFVQGNGRLPIPASFLLREGDAAYGSEGELAPPSCSASAWAAPGGSGMCLSPNGRVLVGAVPFQALGLDEGDTIDAWSQKFVYAVSAAQVDVLTFAPGANQAIEPLAFSTRNGDPPQILRVARTTGGGPLSDIFYDVMILSLGPEGRGAYTRDGVAVRPCDTTLREGENCRFTHRYLLHESPPEVMADGVTMITHGSRSLAANTDYYDDFARGYNYEVSVEWQRSEDRAESLLGVAGSTVGIGTESPNGSYRFHVRGGDLQARDEVHAARMCDQDGNNCFTPEMIGGAMPDMDCTTTMGTEPAIGIGLGILGCSWKAGVHPGIPADVGFTFPNAFVRHLCNWDELVTGFDASGAPICAGRALPP